jgi:2-phosphosulfolactate phosphatase
MSSPTRSQRRQEHPGSERENRPRVASALHLDWGLDGARAAALGGALVVVDVLSFSTAVTIMTGRGSTVYPHTWPSPDVEAFARARDAAWAVGRREVSAEHPWSLSPSDLIAAPAVERLVLPSPNGSAISAAAGASAFGAVAADGVAADGVAADGVPADGVPADGVPADGDPAGDHPADGVPAECVVVAGCLRNASAVAAWLEDAGYGTQERPVTVIAAGERWPDGGLRPALEDLLGAAAIIAAMNGHIIRSPEAAVAEVGWFAHRHHAAEFLRECYSGRELIDRDRGADVTLAAEYDAQDIVPVLEDGAFRRSA